MMRRGLAWALGLAAVAASPLASADQSACAKAAERGQVSRADGKLREARRQFAACSTGCPAVIATDCAAWAEQVLAALA